jgi:hypothetical protein
MVTVRKCSIVMVVPRKVWPSTYWLPQHPTLGNLMHVRCNRSTGGLDSVAVLSKSPQVPQVCFELRNRISAFLIPHLTSA